MGGRRNRHAGTTYTGMFSCFSRRTMSHLVMGEPSGRCRPNGHGASCIIVTKREMGMQWAALRSYFVHASTNSWTLPREPF